MTTKVYKYGALDPKDDRIREQMRLGHRYYNALVEAENARRREIWQADTSAPAEHGCQQGGGKKKCSVCKEHFDAIRSRARERGFLDLKPIRREFSNAGLYWGTYLQIERAFGQAQKDTSIYHPLRFRPWRNGAMAGVQIQASDNPSYFLQMAPADDPRTGRRAGQRHHVWLRLGTDKNKPVWSNPIPVELSRRPQGVVRWAYVQVKRSGDREVWSVHLVCRNVPERNDLAESGAVAIDVGWRKLPDGRVRLAYARGDDGVEHELAMSARWLERWRRADRIRAHRDKLLNELKESDPRFAAVKSPRGAVRKVRKLELDDEHVIAWMKRDRHLWQYETGCREGGVRARREAVREWLRGLRRRYKDAVVKESRHKEMKGSAKDDKMPQKARDQGHKSSPGEIIELVCRQVFEGTTALVESKMTTATCRSCGHENHVGAGLMVKCERCGDERDRDRTSTRNMMDIWGYGNWRWPTARKTSPKFAKTHRS